MTESLARASCIMQQQQQSGLHKYPGRSSVVQKCPIQNIHTSKKPAKSSHKHASHTHPSRSNRPILHSCHLLGRRRPPPLPPLPARQGQLQDRRPPQLLHRGSPPRHRALQPPARDARLRRPARSRGRPGREAGGLHHARGQPRRYDPPKRRGGKGCYCGVAACGERWCGEGIGGAGGGEGRSGRCFAAGACCAALSQGGGDTTLWTAGQGY